ncbi:MAG: hypothetical protein JWO05_715 [Gemmatimonadetes bacterium]|nr:hypothetical protein [Gemmatimonadota bacterium]
MTRDHPHPDRAAAPSLAASFTPGHTARGAIGVPLGTASADISVGGDGVDVLLRGSVNFSAHFPGEDVAEWCRNASALLSADLEAAPADSYELRTPILPAAGRGSIALCRLATSSGSSFVLLLGEAPDSISHRRSDCRLVAATPDAIRGFLTVLGGAAAATMTSRDDVG